MDSPSLLPVMRTNGSSGSGNGWTGTRPSLLTGLARGGVGRCPRCGSGKLFRRWSTMAAACPRCGMHFERSDGYWLGSMMINMAVTIAAFIVVFVGGMLLTWPDVPWTGLTVALVVLMILIPMLFNPVARTLWVAIERHARSRTEPYA